MGLQALFVLFSVVHDFLPTQTDAIGLRLVRDRLLHPLVEDLFWRWLFPRLPSNLLQGVHQLSAHIRKKGYSILLNMRQEPGNELLRLALPDGPTVKAWSGVVTEVLVVHILPVLRSYAKAS